MGQVTVFEAGGRSRASCHLLLTQFGDPDLLQVLPRQLFDDADGVVAIFRQPFVVLREADGAEPLPQLGLRRKSQVRLGPLLLRLLESWSLTGMYSGSQSGMFRLLISMEIFLR